MRSASPRASLRHRALGALGPVLLATLSACSSADAPPPRQLPRGTAMTLRIENHQVEPASILGLVNEEHPVASEPDALPWGMKVFPSSTMDAAIESLERNGFVTHSREVAEVKPPAPRTILRRLSLEVDGRAFVFDVPRQPSKDVAGAFSTMLRPLQDLYNSVDSFRTRDNDDPRYFERAQDQLERQNRARADDRR